MAKTNRSTAEVFVSIGKALREQVLSESSAPSLERCSELMDSLKEEASRNKMSVTLLQKSQIGVTLGKVIKAFRRYKRNDAADAQTEWARLIDMGQKMITEWKSTVAIQNRDGTEVHEEENETDRDNSALPTSVAVYRSRLARHSKEMYKDPPVMPPQAIVIEENKCPPPKRNQKTGLLTFECGQDSDLENLLKDFHPNRTPEEVLRAGSFGGTYFRPITSAVTNQQYKSSDVLRDTVPSSWIDGLDKKALLTSSTYRPQVNKYGVKCGGSLGMWESSGWIADSDPYGWFQWYCRFFQGRRCSDDARQITRWLKCAGPKGRFRSQLCNKILAANARPEDESVSPVIRQTLLHWGLEITPDVLEKHKKRVK